MKKLPVYKLRISDNDDDTSEINFIALVDDPAIMTNWLAFQNIQRFSADHDRRIIMGAAIIADMPIYRKDAKMGEYYVVFDKEEILKCVQKFFRKGYQSNFNMGHDPNQKTEGVYIIESMIIDESRGVCAPNPFQGLSQGSWVISVKVDNESVWQDFIKTGEVKGFSIEGLFGFEDAGNNDVQILEDIVDIVRGL